MLKGMKANGEALDGSGKIAFDTEAELFKHLLDEHGIVVVGEDN